MSIFEVKINDQHSLKGNDYRIENPKANLLVFTGMDEYSARYARFAGDMNKLGYSVSVLDHFGQGENAKSVDEQEQWPKGAWDMELIALKNKVDELKKEGKPVYLMGHSMGSFFMQSYLEHYPNTIEKIIIMGSNGPGSPLGLARFLARITTTNHSWNKTSHFIQKMALGPYTKAIKNAKTPLDWLSYNEENVKKYIADPYCGHSNTKGFYVGFTAGMATLYQTKFKKQISKDEHIYLVSGADDPVGNCSKGVKALYQMYQDLGVKDVTLKIYPQMRHEVLNEDKRDEVIHDLDVFLSK
jgi:alpha-beta hydrolase superfamily lysophospholipase